MTEPQAHRPIKVLVVDDNAVIRMGLRALLGTDPRLVVVGEVDNGRAAVPMAARLRPNVILLDNRMPEADGLSVLPALASLARVLMLTYTHDTASIDTAIRLGACGYLVYGDFPPDELLRAVVSAGPDSAHLSPAATAMMLRQVRGGVSKPPHLVSNDNRVAKLSRREREIMELIASGKSNQKIASDLYLSENTVKNHINHIFGKLQAGNRAEAMALWLGTFQGGSPEEPDQGSATTHLGSSRFP